MRTIKVVDVLPFAELGDEIDIILLGHELIKFLLI
jgi:hypothetical protein